MIVISYVRIGAVLGNLKSVTLVPECTRMCISVVDSEVNLGKGVKPAIVCFFTDCFASHQSISHHEGVNPIWSVIVFYTSAHALTR